MIHFIEDSQRVIKADWTLYSTPLSQTWSLNGQECKNKKVHPVSSIYIWSKNLVAKSEAKDGGN